MRPAATNRPRARDGARAGALAVLREHGPVSRTELARHLDLPKSTVAAVVEELLADGSIVETPACPGGSGSGSGRPARSLRLAGIAGVVVGIDFGHRHVRVALADGDCRILGEDAAEVDVDRRAT